MSKVPDIQTRQAFLESELWLGELASHCGDPRNAGLKELLGDDRRREIRERAEALISLLRIARNDIENPGRKELR